MYEKIHTDTIEIPWHSGQRVAPLMVKLEEVLERAGVREGRVTLQVMDETTGLVVLPSQEVLLLDYLRTLEKLVPETDLYAADVRSLRSHSAYAGAVETLRATVVGQSHTLILHKGHLVIPPISAIYAVDWSSPSSVVVFVQVSGL